MACMLLKAIDLMSGNADEMEFTGKELLDLFMDKAEDDDAPAQYTIGLVYSSKTDILSDDKKTSYWFVKAVAGGNSNAQHLLGLMYLTGSGAEYNPVKAIASASLKLLSNNPL